MLIRIRSELIQLSHIDECARVNRLLEDLRHVRKATTEDIVVPALGHTTNRTAQGKVVQPFFKLFLHVFAEHLGSPYFSLLIAIRSIIFPVVIVIVAHNCAVTPSVLCNLLTSLGSHSLGSALFHINFSCPNCYYPKTTR
jgi:hypothetical protein